MLEARLSFKEWWELYWKNDRTVLMTKAKNDKKKYKIRKRDYISIPANEGYFVDSGFIGAKYRQKKEGILLKLLCKTYRIT